MHKVTVGIVGASGYSGVEAAKILAQHERVELKFVTSDRWEGDTLERRIGIPKPLGLLKFAPLKASAELAAGCQAVFLATPAEVSLELAPQLLEAGVKVIDLSGAFRLREPAAYPRAYGLKHPAPELLPKAVYGIPELFAEDIKDASLIANPGCYPTAAALPLAPLLREGLLAEEGIVVNAASGTTGAGRKGSEDLSFSEVDEDFRAYRVLRHQHGPEIAQTLARSAGKKVPVTFTAHLLPIKRGILATLYARLKPGRKPEELNAALSRFYADAPFVTVLPSPDEVNLKAVVGTNRCAIAVACDTEQGEDPGRVVITSAIDNLVKGAAGQAVQNLNVAMGWPQTLGLGARGFFS